MKEYHILTKSESGDYYNYYIKVDKLPTFSEIKKWLQVNGNDIFDGKCYENIISVTLIKFKNYEKIF